MTTATNDIAATVDEHLNRIRDAAIAVLTVKDIPIHDDPTAVAHLITSAAAENWCITAKDNGPSQVSHEPTYAVLAQRLIDAEAAKQRLERRVRIARKLIDIYCHRGLRPGERDRLEALAATLTGE